MPPPRGLEGSDVLTVGKKDNVAAAEEGPEATEGELGRFKKAATAVVVVQCCSATLFYYSTPHILLLYLTGHTGHRYERVCGG